MLELASPSRAMIWGPGRYRLMVVGVAFSDGAPPISDAWASRTVAEMDAYFREVSGGRLRWSLAETRSVRIPKASQAFHLTRRSLQDRVEFWKLLSGKIGHADGDAVLAVIPEAAAVRGCFAVGPRWNSPRLNAAVARTGEIRRGAVVRASSSWGTVAHELGHVLGLPDLYDYQLARRSAGYAASRFVGPWDLMGRVPDETGGARPHPMAWTKALVGWIAPEEWQPGRPHLLDPERSPAVRIPITDRAALFVEARSRTGFDAVLPSDGVLVSLADAERTEGRGPLRILRAGRPAADWQVALQPGDALRHGAMRVRVKDRSESGYTVEIETEGAS